MTRCCIHACRLAVGLALVSASSLAHAEPGNDVFRWDAPALECPSEAEVLKRLELMLDAPLDELREHEVFFIARVRRGDDGRWELLLFGLTKSGRKERQVHADDCESLADHAALLTSLAIETPTKPLAAIPIVNIQAPEAPKAHAAVPALDRDTVELRPVPRPEPTRRFVVAARLQGGGSSGELPSFGPVVRLALALQWERARIEIASHYGFRRSIALESGQRVDISDALMLARGCWVGRVRRAKLEFPLCAGVEFGALLATGTTVARSRAGWFGLDLAPGIVWSPLRWLALSVTLEPWLAPRPGELVTSRGEVLWRPGLAGVRILGGGEVRF